MSKHRYRIFDEDMGSKKKEHYKKKRHQQNKASIKYFKYFITNSDDSRLYPNEKFKADSVHGNGGIQFYKTAFETILWIESRIAKIEDLGDNKQCVIYQIKPLGPVTEQMYSNGLTLCSAEGIEIIEEYSFDKMGRQIHEEFQNKIHPYHNQYSTNLGFAKKIYEMYANRR